jgi:hypothetical protein
VYDRVWHRRFRKHRAVANDLQRRWHGTDRTLWLKIEQKGATAHSPRSVAVGPCCVLRVLTRVLVPRQVRPAHASLRCCGPGRTCFTVLFHLFYCTFVSLCITLYLSVYHHISPCIIVYPKKKFGYGYRGWFCDTCEIKGDISQNSCRITRHVSRVSCMYHACITYISVIFCCLQLL